MNPGFEPRKWEILQEVMAEADRQQTAGVPITEVFLQRRHAIRMAAMALRAVEVHDAKR